MEKLQYLSNGVADFYEIWRDDVALASRPLGQVGPTFNPPHGTTSDLVQLLGQKKSCFEQKNALSRFTLILFKLHESWKLILRNIINIFATRCHICKLKCTKFGFGWGSARWGSLQRSPRPANWI